MNRFNLFTDANNTLCVAIVVIVLAALFFLPGPTALIIVLVVAVTWAVRTDVLAWRQKQRLAQDINKSVSMFATGSFRHPDKQREDQ